MTEKPVAYEYKGKTVSGTTYRIQLVRPPAAKVTLITHTYNSNSTLYLLTRAFKGFYTDFVTLEEIEEYPTEQAFNDIRNTKLTNPLEFIHMTWLFQDVTRAFTHQLVRYRVGTAFVQESMRFFGMKGIFKVLVTHKAGDPESIGSYAHGAVNAINDYVALLDRGVPSEDARGILPTNILTNIYFDCSLRTLQGIFPQRLCCQAQQGEWQPILLDMRRQIKAEMGEEIEKLLRAPYESGQPCGYRASFDRPCIWTKEGDDGTTGSENTKTGA